MSAKEIRLSALLAPSFYEVHRDLRAGRHIHYYLGGGRGSGKSSFVSLEIIFGMMADRSANAVVIRKVGRFLRDSVYEQLVWAIERLGAAEEWETRPSIPELVYRPTGQRVLFRGADAPKKLKSTKVAEGYIRYIWYEEADEFAGREEIDLMNQSFLRGGAVFTCFYSFNPPKSPEHWLNRLVERPRADRLFHLSDYRRVPREWLGERFIAEAEYLKTEDPLRYRNEYLGEAVGTGAEIFPNVAIRPIGDDEIASAERVLRGLDWGFGADPFVYLALIYDRRARRVLIYHEFYRYGARFDEIAAAIARENPTRGLVTAESAEPRSNDELRDRGVRLRAAKKGQGSIEQGIRWLQNLNEIVIDPIRCPNARREFGGYRFEADGAGGFRGGFPDRDNHTIDAARYALEEVALRRGVGAIDRRKLGI
ncbi:MAG: phage terminase large subunit [Bacteroides sp.]|nr:phage terminase large subunit [Eubacterium sp.]MCM1417938.1 phage terminase large subunit [Roseburia sp.]MCM1461815.1 phage terminase large subunit [Bacteroides sp.]